MIHKVVFDTYPAKGGKWDGECSCAIIEAFILIRPEDSIEEKKKSAVSDMLEEGWAVSCEMETYLSDIPEEEGLAVSLNETGFAFRVGQVPIEVMFYDEDSVCDEKNISVSALLNKFTSRSELFSLYSKTDQQYANGVTPNGDNFLPLWDSIEQAEKWKSYYVGYEVKLISKKHYIEYICPELLKVDYLVTIGSMDFLVTVHPTNVLNELV